ncbi:dTDP-glucose 4,6-dehydratase [Oceaniferula spumae]|uniref:dTDP-glucose 4,6-dehydratase n=1 Tax=Oceaniferula spumae TaxID=2979115 RepID=A0AAT9FNY9_9BACT
MKILITGGAGFIGSNLIHQILAQTDYQVVNLDKLTYAGNVESLKSVAEDPRYTFEQIDLCKAPAVAEALEKYKPDAIIHLAAESHVDRSIDGPSEFIQTNIIGTFNLLQAALAYWQKLPDEPVQVDSSSSRTQNSNSNYTPPTKSGFRFLHVSTDEVYGSLDLNSPGFSENTPYDPHSPYSASKASSDHLVRAWYHTYGLPVLITNCSNNYGPYQFPEKLIPVVILKCLNMEPIPVYGKGENIRDWLHVSDNCSALLRVLQSGEPGRTYNVGGNNEMRNIDLVRLICSMLDEVSPINSDSSLELPTDKEIKSYQDLISFVTDRPGHDMRYGIDTSRISDDLGWQPAVGAESGFRKTVQWYLDNKAWWQRILDGSY